MNNGDFILQYFKDNGIRKGKSLSTFYNQLERKFGQIARDFRNEVEARADDTTTGVDIYQIKNESLAFADAICSQFDSDRLRQFTARIMDVVQDGQTVLDFGCDNGFVLCCLAKRYPKGKFIGIDINQKAIEVAKERAKKFNLTNVEFFGGTLEEVIAQQKLTHFDVAISGFIFHEIINPNLETEKLVFSLAELDEEISKNLYDVPELVILKSCLDNGTLISMDRWDGSENLLFWIRLCEKHGFNLIPQACAMVDFDNGGQETVPVTVFTVSDTKAAVSILDFLNIRTHLNNYIFTQARYEFENEKAEHVHMMLEYQPIFEEIFEQGPNDKGITLIGLSDKYSVVYQTHSSGGRALKLFPPQKLKDLWQTLSNYKQYKESVGTLSERIINPGLYQRMLAD